MDEIIYQQRWDGLVWYADKKILMQQDVSARLGSISLNKEKLRKIIDILTGCHDQRMHLHIIQNMCRDYAG